MVLEHVDLYASTGPAPVNDADLDICLPVGKAAVRREGSQVTVITYLAMTNYVLAAVEEVGEVDAEVIDLRWLDRASLDWETVGESIRKTNRVMIAEQGAVGTSYGGWLADEIERRFFDWLDAPIERVTGGVASPSISKVLERAAIAKDDEMAVALRQSGEHLMATLLRMPEIAAAMTEAVIQEWKVAENATFAAGDTLAEIETDKAVIDFEAETAGVVLRLLAEAGVTIDVGAPIAVIGDADEAGADVDALLAALGVTDGTAPNSSAATADTAAVDTAAEDTTAGDATAAGSAAAPAPTPDSTGAEVPPDDTVVSVGAEEPVASDAATAGPDDAPATDDHPTPRPPRRPPPPVAAPTAARDRGSSPARWPGGWPGNPTSTSPRCTAPAPAAGSSASDIEGALHRRTQRPCTARRPRPRPRHPHRP